MRCGILLAGGRSTRLYPASIGVNKHLLAVYDKPMIYYSLSLIMMANIEDILVITTPEALSPMQKLLGDGRHLGLNITYARQPAPKGIADAFLIGEEFIGGRSVMLVLGDNILHGNGLGDMLQMASLQEKSARIYAYRVKNPARYGVVELDGDGNPVSVEEKPANPKSPYAVPGVYFYDNEVVCMASRLVPSARKELEITDINNAYIGQGRMRVDVLGRGITWMDAGTPESLMQAANYVYAVQERQGVLVASPEEVAYRKGFIDHEQFLGLAEDLQCSSYGQTLLALAKE